MISSSSRDRHQHELHVPAATQARSENKHIGICFLPARLLVALLVADLLQLNNGRWALQFAVGISAPHCGPPHNYVANFGFRREWGRRHPRSNKLQLTRAARACSLPSHTPNVYPRRRRRRRLSSIWAAIWWWALWSQSRVSRFYQHNGTVIGVPQNCRCVLI